MNTDLLWAIAVMFLLALLKAGVTELQAWRTSKNAQNHPALLALAPIGLDVANAAIAWLSNNPTAKASDALAWAVSEWKAAGPQLIAEAGSAVTDVGLRYAMTKKMLTAAQTSNLSDAAGRVIKELAPSAITARVTPTQVAAVVSDVATAAPLTAETLLALFPGVAAFKAPAPAAPAIATAGAAST